MASNFPSAFPDLHPITPKGGPHSHANSKGGTPLADFSDHDRSRDEHPEDDLENDMSAETVLHSSSMSSGMGMSMSGVDSLQNLSHTSSTGKLANNTSTSRNDEHTGNISTPHWPCAFLPQHTHAPDTASATL